MIYDILNDGGDITGQLGLSWTAYAMDQKGNVWPVGSATSKSNTVDDQLMALYVLQGMILLDDKDVLLRDIHITGESLSLSTNSKSLVKQWIISKMNKP